MGKLEDYGILAKKLYVEEQQTLAQISKNLNIEIQDLQAWKSNFEWDRERQQFLSSKFTCYSALQELLHYLAKDALAKIKSGEVPESASLNFIAKMAEKLPKIIEQNDSREEKPKDTDKTTEIAKIIDEKLVNG